MSTLANARDVLRLLVRAQRDLTVTEVAAELGQPKSSVSRTLALMADYGFLDRNPVTLAYGPGELIIGSAYRPRESENVTVLLSDALASLVRETGCTGYVNILDGAESLVIQMRTSPENRLPAYTPEGTTAPAYATSMGRALLARLDDASVEALIGGRFSEAVGSAPRTTEELLSALERVRSIGWARSAGEIVANVGGVSAAVMDPSDHRLYGIGIAFAAQVVDAVAVETYGAAVRAAAERVGVRIGDPYWLRYATPEDALTGSR